MSPAARLAALPVLAYRRWLSPALPPRCRFHPSCSEYAVQSLERYGMIRGLVLASWRVLRCNPFSAGGVDPVDAQRLFRPRPAPSAPEPR